jgi:hypothetical protein
MSNRWMPQHEMGAPVDPRHSLAEALELHREGPAPLSSQPSYPAGPPQHAPAPPPLPGAASGEATQILSDALEVRARLIAEAHAATEALNKLRRLLEPESLRELGQLVRDVAEERVSPAPILPPVPSMFALVPVAEERGMFLPATLPYPDSTMQHVSIRGFMFGLVLASLIGAGLYILLYLN